MARGYVHVDPEMAGSWTMIENMRDAFECVEELLFIARCYGRSRKIDNALEKFYEFSRGEKLPNPKDRYGRAYLATQKVMRSAQP